MITHSLPTASPTAPACYWVPLLLASTATALVALGVMAPWTVAIWGGMIILALSFVENGPFLLLLIFLLPVDAILGPNSLVRDVSVAVRSLVAVGFFFGRFHRGQIRLNRLRQPAISLASVLFLASLVISALLGVPGQKHAEARGIYFIGSYVGFYLVMLAWLDTTQRLQKLALALFSSTVLVAVFGVVQEFAGRYTALWHLLYRVDEDITAGVEATGRIPSFLGHPNHLAGYLNLILPFAIACCLLSTERLWKRVSALTVALGTVTLLLTQSRGGYIAFACTIVVAIWHFAKSCRRRVLLIGVFTALGFAAYILLQQWNPTHFEGYTNDLSLLSRAVLWYTAWTLFLSSPLHGVGFGTFSLIADHYLPQLPDLEAGLQVHNIYLELLAETGILGFISFFVLVAATFREARRQLRSTGWFEHSLAFGVTGGTVAILVHSFFEHDIFWAPQTGGLFWILLATIVAAPFRNVKAGVKG